MISVLCQSGTLERVELVWGRSSLTVEGANTLRSVTVNDIDGYMIVVNTTSAMSSQKPSAASSSYLVLVLPGSYDLPLSFPSNDDSEEAARLVTEMKRLRGSKERLVRYEMNCFDDMLPFVRWAPTDPTVSIPFRHSKLDFMQLNGNRSVTSRLSMQGDGCIEFSGKVRSMVGAAEEEMVCIVSDRAIYMAEASGTLTTRLSFADIAVLEVGREFLIALEDGSSQSPKLHLLTKYATDIVRRMQAAGFDSTKIRRDTAGYVPAVRPIQLSAASPPSIPSRQRSASRPMDDSPEVDGDDCDIIMVRSCSASPQLYQGAKSPLRHQQHADEADGRCLITELGEAKQEMIELRDELKRVESHSEELRAQLVRALNLDASPTASPPGTATTTSAKASGRRSKSPSVGRRSVDRASSVSSSAEKQKTAKADEVAKFCVSLVNRLKWSERERLENRLRFLEYEITKRSDASERPPATSQDVEALRYALFKSKEHARFLEDRVVLHQDENRRLMEATTTVGEEVQTALQQCTEDVKKEAANYHWSAFLRDEQLVEQRIIDEAKERTHFLREENDKLVAELRDKEGIIAQLSGRSASVDDGNLKQLQLTARQAHQEAKIRSLARQIEDLKLARKTLNDEIAIMCPTAERGAIAKVAASSDATYIAGLERFTNVPLAITRICALEEQLKQADDNTKSLAAALAEKHAMESELVSVNKARDAQREELQKLKRKHTELMQQYNGLRGEVGDRKQSAKDLEERHTREVADLKRQVKHQRERISELLASIKQRPKVERGAFSEGGCSPQSPPPPDVAGESDRDRLVAQLRERTERCQHLEIAWQAIVDSHPDLRMEAEMLLGRATVNGMTERASPSHKPQTERLRFLEQRNSELEARLLESEQSVQSRIDHAIDAARRRFAQEHEQSTDIHREHIDHLTRVMGDLENEVSELRVERGQTPQHTPAQHNDEKASSTWQPQGARPSRSVDAWESARTPRSTSRRQLAVQRRSQTPSERFVGSRSTSTRTASPFLSGNDCDDPVELAQQRCNLVRQKMLSGSVVSTDKENCGDGGKVYGSRSTAHKTASRDDDPMQRLLQTCSVMRERLNSN